MTAAKTVYVSTSWHRVRYFGGWEWSGEVAAGLRRQQIASGRNRGPSHSVVSIVAHSHDVMYSSSGSRTTKAT